MLLQQSRGLLVDLRFAVPRDKCSRRTFVLNTAMVCNCLVVCFVLFLGGFAQIQSAHNPCVHYLTGLLEKQDLPFRMTRCLTEFIGPFLLEGVFVPSFASASSAMHSKRRVLESILHLLLRDDAMAWYISKSSGRIDSKMQEVDRHLSARVLNNVRFVQDRFEECSPRVVEDAAEEAIEPNVEPIDIKVRDLVETATSEEKLSMMPATYHAWL